MSKIFGRIIVSFIRFYYIGFVNFLMVFSDKFVIIGIIVEVVIVFDGFYDISRNRMR